MISDAQLDEWALWAREAKRMANEMTTLRALNIAELAGRAIPALIGEVRRLRADNVELCRDSEAEHRCLKTICGMLTDAGCSVGEFHDLHVPVREVIAKLAEARRLLERASGTVECGDTYDAIARFLGPAKEGAKP